MAGGNSIYRAKKSPALANPITTAVVFKQSDDSTLATFVKIPSSSANIINGRKFRVRASGTATWGTAGNFKATIQYSSNITLTNAATSTNNTDMVALTNRNPGSAVTRSWYIEADCVWDSTSQRLTGQANGLNSETIETANAAITALTAVDLSTETTGFVVSALFGTSNASNSVSLVDFSLEVL